MRPLWTGSLSFGLVNIPVKMYGAARESTPSFHFLHKEDLSPIRYAKICRRDGKEIPYEEIVRGYEYRKGDYVVLSDEEIGKAAPRSTQTIDISDFVNEREIDEIYLEKPYFLEPDEDARKAYALLREALSRSKKVGIATYVIRGREHLGVIKPEGKALVLIQMRFREEVKPPRGLSLPGGESLKQKELSMALRLIDELSAHFEISKYKDTFAEEVREAASRKAKGRPIVREEEPVRRTEIEDLVSALRKSLEASRK